MTARLEVHVSDLESGGAGRRRQKLHSRWPRGGRDGRLGKKVGHFSEDPEAIRELVLMRELNNFDTLCNTGDGVYIVDANKHIIRWNKGAEKILKYAESDVLNRDCYRVISGKTAPGKPVCSQNCKIHAGVIQGAIQENFDILTRTNAGESLWLNVSIVAPTTPGDPFVAHIIRDITREKRKALALDHFLANLENHDPATEDAFGEKPAAESCRTAHCQAPDKSSTALSGREIEVLTLLAEGLSTKSLAQKLSISHFTARNHILNILVILDLHSKAQAVSYAFKKGIL